MGVTPDLMLVQMLMIRGGRVAYISVDGKWWHSWTLRRAAPRRPREGPRCGAGRGGAKVVVKIRARADQIAEEGGVTAWKLDCPQRPKYKPVLAAGYM